MQEKFLTVNTKEVQKFSQLADSWWDETSKNFKLLHIINPARVKFVIDHILKHFPTHQQINLLDLGCGGGIFCESIYKSLTYWYKDKKISVTGIDAAEQNIATATHHATNSKLDISYHACDIAHFDHNKKFNIITCLEVLEHVDDPATLINHLSNHLEPNGLIIFSTINKTLKAKLLAVCMAEYILNIVPQGTHDYNKFIHPTQITSIAKKFGIEELETKGMKFIPFLNKVTLCNDTDINYFWVGVKRS